MRESLMRLSISVSLTQASIHYEPAFVRRDTSHLKEADGARSHQAGYLGAETEAGSSKSSLDVVHQISRRNTFRNSAMRHSAMVRKKLDSDSHRDLQNRHKNVQNEDDDITVDSSVVQTGESDEPELVVKTDKSEVSEAQETAIKPDQLAVESDGNAETEASSAESDGKMRRILIDAEGEPIYEPTTKPEVFIVNENPPEGTVPCDKVWDADKEHYGGSKSSKQFVNNDVPQALMNSARNLPAEIPEPLINDTRTEKVSQVSKDVASKKIRGLTALERTQTPSVTSSAHSFLQRETIFEVVNVTTSGQIVERKVSENAHNFLASSGGTKTSFSGGSNTTLLRTLNTENDASDANHVSNVVSKKVGSGLKSESGEASMTEKSSSEGRRLAQAGRTCPVDKNGKSNGGVVVKALNPNAAPAGQGWTGPLCGNMCALNQGCEFYVSFAPQCTLMKQMTSEEFGGQGNTLQGLNSASCLPKGCAPWTQTGSNADPVYKMFTVQEFDWERCAATCSSPCVMWSFETSSKSCSLYRDVGTYKPAASGFIEGFRSDDCIGSSTMVASIVSLVVQISLCLIFILALGVLAKNAGALSGFRDRIMMRDGYVRRSDGGSGGSTPGANLRMVSSENIRRIQSGQPRFVPHGGRMQFDRINTAGGAVGIRTAGGTRISGGGIGTSGGPQGTGTNGGIGADGVVTPATRSSDMPSSDRGSKGNRNGETDSSFLTPPQRPSTPGDVGTPSGGNKARDLARKIVDFNVATTTRIPEDNEKDKDKDKEARRAERASRTGEKETRRADKKA